VAWCSHSATQPRRRSGKSGWSSRSARVAGPAALPEWLSGCFDFASRVAHPLLYLLAKIKIKMAVYFLLDILFNVRWNNSLKT